MHTTFCVKNYFAHCNTTERIPMTLMQCSACFFPYDPALGLPDEGIPPGTRWEDIPDDWVCPDCGTPKHLFIEQTG
jgi:rubredoxin